MIKELSPSADEVGDYWFLLCGSANNVEMTFICDLLGVGHHSNKLFDEGHE
jgi:hypothetical protein